MSCRHSAPMACKGKCSLTCWCICLENGIAVTSGNKPETRFSWAMILLLAWSIFILIRRIVKTFLPMENVLEWMKNQEIRDVRWRHFWSTCRSWTRWTCTCGKGPKHPSNIMLVKMTPSGMKMPQLGIIPWGRWWQICPSLHGYPGFTQIIVSEVLMWQFSTA